MAVSRHFTLSYYFPQKQSRIITPVNLCPIPFNPTLSLTTDALWDTGASISAVTPEIQKQNNISINVMHIFPHAAFSHAPFSSGISEGFAYAFNLPKAECFTVFTEASGAVIEEKLKIWYFKPIQRGMAYF